MISPCRYVLAGAAVLLTACAQPGATPPPQQASSGGVGLTFTRVSRDIDVAAVARSIGLCKTSETDLRGQLGPPSRDGLLHGARVLTWITEAESPHRYLGVLLDTDGVVVDVYWDIPTESPWIPTDQCPR